MADVHKVIVSGIELTTANEHQILNMGGPHIGDLSIGNDLISKDCIINNFIYKEDMNLLFFIKYHRINLYQYFTINFYNFGTKAVCEFDREFDMVYLSNFKSKNELEIYPAFHDSFKNKQLIFNLDNEGFSQLKN